MDSDFRASIATGTRDPAEQATLSETLEGVLDMCTRALAHCDMAGVSVAEGHTVRTVVASSERLRVVDDLQLRVWDGPCLDSLRSEEAVISNDVATDDRWPRWGPLVSERAGVHASLSFRLFTTRSTLGALNVYSTRPEPSTATT